MPVNSEEGLTLQGSVSVAMPSAPELNPPVLLSCHDWSGVETAIRYRSSENQSFMVRALRWICGKAGRRRSGTRGDYGHMMVDFRPYRSPLCLGIIQKMPRHLQLIAPCSQLWPLQNARRFYEVIPLALLRFLHKISRFTTLSAW